jgi:hypothetical protein
MDIEKLKKDYKNMRVPKMDVSINNVASMEDFIQKIKKQDKEDEKYILHNRMIPVFIGLFLITIIMLFNPMKSPLLLAGLLLIFLGFFSTLILLFKDYKNISQESYDLSLFAYLRQKKERLKSWRSTPAKYQLTFIVFLTGLIMMNISLWRNLAPEYFVLALVVYLILLAAAWIIGEHFYRKRHMKKHQPLIKNINDLIKELGEEKNNI